MYDLTIGLYNDHEAMEFLSAKKNVAISDGGGGKEKVYSPRIERAFKR